MRAAIVGLGLIGASIGAALQRSGWKVRGYDANARAASVALSRGLVDELCPSPECTLLDASVVVLAVPIAAILDLLDRIDALAPPNAVLIDTGSVKGPVVDRMEGLAGAGRAIGGHPLAGRERSGPEWADPDMFSGRPFVLTPSRLTHETTIAEATSFVRLLGAEPVVPIDARRHDRVLASTSHLPQLLSTALALTVDPGDRYLSGPAFHDMTRLAASDPAMWRDIFLANRANVTEAIGAFVAVLQSMAEVISAEDSEEMLRTMERGRDAAQRLGGQVTP